MEITIGELQSFMMGKTVETGYEEYLGKSIFIRTVTHHYTGRVTKVTSMTLKLEDAAWIPDDGRFNESMKDQTKFLEVEPYAKPVTINLMAIIDVTEITLLPREIK